MRDAPYQGSSRQYDAIVERDVAVPARDGINLMTDLYRPAIGGRAVSGQFPVLLCRTPYNKVAQHQAGMYFAKFGYVCAVQDWRQTQGEYEHDHWRPSHEAPDGYDAIEWLAAQPWSNGRVGFWGHSAMGQTIQAVLALRPPSLESAYIIDSGFNYGTHYARINGAFSQAFRLRHTLRMMELNEQNPRLKDMFRDAYLDPTKYFSSFSRPHSPIQKGETILALSPSYEKRYLKIATTSDIDDDYWKDAGKTEEERIHDWKDIPIFFLSAWYGNHLTENILKFQILRERFNSPVRMLIGPWEHNMVSTFAGSVDFGLEAKDVDVFWLQRLQWFDQTLKGLDTGLFDTPAVRYFVMGGGSGAKTMDGRLQHGGQWEYGENWPPSNVRATPYYMRAGGGLSEFPPEADDSCSVYTYDPRDPVPSVGGNFMDYSRPDFPANVTWMPDGGAQDQRGNPQKPFCNDGAPLSARDDVIVFQTAALDQDVEVTGDLVARLWVSSTAPDTDFTIKLIDVHPATNAFPEGFSMNLQDSVVRMRFRSDQRKETMIDPGEIYMVELPLNSTSNLFRKGHRIRVDVSSSNFPVFDVNPNTGGPLGMPGPVRSAENMIYHDKDHPSHVVLPVATRTLAGNGRTHS